MFYVLIHKVVIIIIFLEVFYELKYIELNLCG